MATDDKNGPRFIDMAGKQTTYADLVTQVIADGFYTFPEPNIWLPIDVIDELAGWFVRSVPWVGSILISLEIPDYTDDRSIIDELFEKIRSGIITVAQNRMDLSYVLSDEIQDGDTAEILFHDQRFQTVGILIHELAHLYRPDLSSSHGSDFLWACDYLRRHFDERFGRLDYLVDIDDNRCHHFWYELKKIIASAD